MPIFWGNNLAQALSGFLLISIRAFGVLCFWATRGQNRYRFKVEPFTLTKSLLFASCIIENSLDCPKYLKILMGLSESERKGSQHKAFYASLLHLVWSLAMLDCNRFTFVAYGFSCIAAVLHILHYARGVCSPLQENLLNINARTLLT